MKTVKIKLSNDFIKDCKLINLLYEYGVGYTGKEKWAIITDLSEAELERKYPDILIAFEPYIVLGSGFNEIRDEFRRNENKHLMRNMRSVDILCFDDALIEVLHPELINTSMEDDFILKNEMEFLQKKIAKMDDVSKSRLKKFFFENKTYEQIAKEESVSKTAVFKSIKTAIKKLRVCCEVYQ